MTPIPAGWKLVEALRESLLWTASSLAAVGKEQDVITLEGRKRTIGEILDEANAALDASPASVAPGDAQAVAWMNPETQDVITNERKVSWLTTYGVGMAAKAAAYSQPLGVLAAPAAGDALDKARLDWLEQHDGRFYNKDRISSIVGTGFLVAGDEQGVRHQTVRAAIDAAIAAQVPQQGEA